MKDATNREINILIELLQICIDRLKSGTCHLSHDAVVSAVEYAQKLASPAENNLTAYQVCKELGGITERTLRNYVATGMIARPHQIAGCTNNFWYSSDVVECRRKLKR